MSVNIDELGTIDWIVLEFPETKMTGEIAPILKDLVDRKLVRVLDLLFLTRDLKGATRCSRPPTWRRARSVSCAHTSASWRCC